MKPISRDTSPEAEAVMIEIYRRMPAWRKMQIVDDANRAARQLAWAGLRSRHPGESTERLLRRLLFPRGDSSFDREEFARGRPETIGQEPGRRMIVKSPEDTVLRKLHWYREGSEVSERQWNDVLGVLRTQGERLDDGYLSRWASTLGIADPLERARSENR